MYAHVGWHANSKTLSVSIINKYGTGLHLGTDSCVYGTGLYLATASCVYGTGLYLATASCAGPLKLGLGMHSTQEAVSQTGAVARTCMGMGAQSHTRIEDDADAWGGDSLDHMDALREEAQLLPLPNQGLAPEVIPNNADKERQRKPPTPAKRSSRHGK